MPKNFQNWTLVKENLQESPHATIKPVFFKEREVWWLSLGLNVGDEEDGKGERFERPIIIIKKFNNNLFWGCALSSKIKDNKYYIGFELLGIKRSVILSQLRVLDSKRLSEKVGMASEEDFKKIKKAVKELL
jgi:mRNA interferase MazF